MANQVPRFRSEDWFDLNESGPVAIVVLDRETADFAHLIGQSVIVNGKTYRCLEVERQAHAAPWKAGELIGLVLQL